MLCQHTLFCNQSPSQTAHLRLAYLITTFLHPLEIISYHDLVASGSVVHYSPNTTSDMVMRDWRVEQRIVLNPTMPSLFHG